MKADKEKNVFSPQGDRLKHFVRRGSSGSDEEIDEKAEDMGLYGHNLAEYN